jgi:flagella basal body P-ring formation protein FlgA
MRASNTLLTLHPFCSEAMPTVQAKPREFGLTVGCPLTPFHNHQAGYSGLSRTLLDMSSLPRISSRSRLGEGSVRSSLEGFLLLLILISAFAFAASAQAAEADTGRPEALVQLVRSHIAAVTPWKETEIQVRSIGSFPAAELPSGEVSFRISATGPLSTYRNALLPVEILQGGKQVRMVWIAADIAIRANVVQAATRLAFGSTISEGDVKETLTEISDARAQYLRSCSEAIGKVLRRTLSPGDPLTRDYVSNPLLVHTGETVRVRMERGPIALSATARAEQNGKLGELITIRSLEFSRSLKATVVARGEVRIE